MPSQPFEIVSGPITLYRAAVGTAAPEISQDPPSGTWTQIGTNGDKNYSEEGVIVDPQATYEKQRVLGSTAPQKAYRTEEDLMVTVTLLDMTAETFAFLMNDASITETPASAGVGGIRSVPLLRGEDVDEFAILARGFSPYAAALAAQYHVPRVFVEDLGQIPHVKGDGAGLAVTFGALEHSTDGFGDYIPQFAPAS